MTDEGGDVNWAESRDPDLTVIVVSFNTREMTLACLRSIVAETYSTNYEVIIVDNNSSDGSVDAIRREFPQFKLIASKENYGFARGNNVAAEFARGRRLLLLNPDTLILDNAIDRLLAFANANPSFQIWGGRTLSGDGSLDPTSCWRRITIWNLFCYASGLSHMAPNNPILNSEAYGGWKRDTIRHVNIVTGCFLLINKTLWDRLKGFDPAFFMYGDEADLCHRARQFGARPAISPNATIVHYGGASDTDLLERRLKIFKGRMTLIRKHFSAPAYKIARALHLSVPVTRWWAFRLKARLTNSPEADHKADDWHLVWQRRNEWSNGYSDFAAPSFSKKKFRRLIKLVISAGYFAAQKICRLWLRIFGRPLSQQLTVLCYHGVPAEYRPKFARQLDMLCKWANVVPASYQGKLPFGKQPVAITFDDAFVSVVQNALPELRARSLHSTIFAPVSWLGKRPNWSMDSTWPYREDVVVTREDLSKLPSSLVSVGSHSLSHPRLSKLDRESAINEIAGSRAALRAILGQDVRQFAMPYGDYNSSILEHCKDAGYDSAFSLLPKEVDTGRSEIHRGRILVDPYDWPMEFFLKSNGAYAWTGHLRVVKAIVGTRWRQLLAVARGEMRPRLSASE